MLNELRKIVKQKTDEEDWKYHIVPVVRYAKKLAKIKKVDEELTEICALLHDIGRIKHGSKNHHITGQIEAEKILEKLKASKETIETVKNCIRTHGGKKENMPRTIYEKIISSADAMAHFDIILMFFYWGNQGSFEEMFNQVKERVEFDWNNKLQIPIAKKMMKRKYKAVKLILEANEQYL